MASSVRRAAQPDPAAVPAALNEKVRKMFVSAGDLLHSFQTFDEDGDGKLTEEEVVGALTRPGGKNPMSPEAARRLWKEWLAEYDADHDGTLAYDELSVKLATGKDEWMAFLNEAPLGSAGAPLRCQVLSCYKIKDIGNVLGIKVLQGTLKTGDEIAFVPTHTPSTACVGKVKDIELATRRSASLEPTGRRAGS